METQHRRRAASFIIPRSCSVSVFLVHSRVCCSISDEIILRHFISVYFFLSTTILLLFCVPIAARATVFIIHLHFIRTTGLSKNTFFYQSRNTHKIYDTVHSERIYLLIIYNRRIVNEAINV